jgi:hypothetical protein
MCVDIEDEEYLNTGIWKAFLPELYEIAPDSPIILRLLPQHSPIVKCNVMGEMLGMWIQYFVVEFHVYVDELLQRAFSIRLDAKSLGGLRLNEKRNTVKFYLKSIEVKSTILTEDLCDIRDPALEKFLPWLMEYILPSLVRALEDFPIPSFEGYSIDVKAILPIGSNKDYLSIYGNLIETE